MANEGPDTNGSQFFITLAPVDRLNFLHSVFGRTVRGAGVLPSVAQGDVMHVRILRIGAAARAFRADDAAFSALEAGAPRYNAPREPGAASLFADPMDFSHGSPAGPEFQLQAGQCEARNRRKGLRPDLCEVRRRRSRGQSREIHPDARHIAWSRQ